MGWRRIQSLGARKQTLSAMATNADKATHRHSGIALSHNRVAIQRVFSRLTKVENGAEVFIRTPGRRRLDAALRA